MPDLVQKQCSKCHQNLPIEQFHKDSRRKDGVFIWCKRCSSTAKWKRCTKCKKEKNSHGFSAGQLRCKECQFAAGVWFCCSCKKIKPLEKFGKSTIRTRGFNIRCKACCRDDQQKNRHAISEYKRERNFGMSRGTYASMFASQGGVCAICKQPSSQVRQGKLVALHVDHDHATSQVRGLLCVDCNLGIGRLKNNPELMEQAAEYVRRHLSQ